MHFSTATILLAALASFTSATPLRSRDTKFYLQSPGFFQMYGFSPVNGAAVCDHLPKKDGYTVRLHKDLMGPIGKEACNKKVTIFFIPEVAGIPSENQDVLTSVEATVYGMCVDPAHCKQTYQVELEPGLFNLIYKDGDTEKGIWPAIGAMVSGPNP